MLAEKVIRKHVSIIHAYSLMSMLQRKIINVLLYEAIKSHHPPSSCRSVAIECNMPLSTLSKAVKFNSHNHQYLKEAIDGLASLKIEWNLLKDKTPADISFLNLRILHGSPTFYKNNTFNFSFHRVMIDLVKNPAVYGTIDVDLQSEFESKYSHALYENSTRFINLQKNKTIHLETLRKILGVQQDKYMNVRELTRNVIVPAMEEVNDRSSFMVGLGAIKSGRKTIGFDILIKNKKKTLNPTDHPVLHRHDSVKKIIEKEFGMISESVLKHIFKRYSEEYVLEKINYTKQYAQKNDSGFYPIPYLLSAIKHDYQLKEIKRSDNMGEKKQNECTDWQTKLHLLQSDLRHWQDRLVSANASKKKSDIKAIETIVSACEEKIKHHYLEQPAPQGAC